MQTQSIINKVYPIKAEDRNVKSEIRNMARTKNFRHREQDSGKASHKEDSVSVEMARAEMSQGQYSER